MNDLQRNCSQNVSDASVRSSAPELRNYSDEELLTHADVWGNGGNLYANYTTADKIMLLFIVNLMRGIDVSYIAEGLAQTYGLDLVMRVMDCLPDTVHG